MKSPRAEESTVILNSKKDVSFKIDWLHENTCILNCFAISRVVGQIERISSDF